MRNIIKRLFITILCFSFVACSVVVAFLILDSYPIEQSYNVTCNWNEQSFATSSLRNYDIKPKIESWSNELRTVSASKCFSLSYEASTTLQKIEGGKFKTKWPEGFTLKQIYEAGGIPVQLNYSSAASYIDEINKELGIDLSRDDAFVVTQKDIIWKSVWKFVWRLIGSI